MERTTSVDQEEGDLEIISIGALYRGHWENKYWSSSRGKDRYPYPVGYHASRTHAGNTCHMEISQGPKGPLFIVKTSDGDLCTGFTPDLAWESFHKKSTPKTKISQVKRKFSSKFDGTEAFGFKNKVVQRLFRELIAESNRSPVQQIPPSPVEQNQITSSSTKNTRPNLIVYSRKRSAKNKTKERENTVHEESPLPQVNNELETTPNFSSQDQGCSEKQELTRSMMEFLLPQAIPLLPAKGPKKTNNKNNISSNENNESKERKNTEPLNNLEEVNCVIADSFEDDSNENSESSISEPGPVTKQGTDLQNDNFFTDSFLASLEEEFRAIENSKTSDNTDNQFTNLPHDNGTYKELNPNPLGSFEHPEPVLSLSLSSKDNCLEISVLCGELNACKRSLYVYNFAGPQPRFVGYTNMVFNSNENLSLGRAGLQYISEERLIALVPSINIPYCSKSSMNCLCAICEAERGEDDYLKLVGLDFGFVVPVMKMKTSEKVSSILACKSNYMIATESTRLHVWIMSSTWSEFSDEFTVPASSILELKEVPDKSGAHVLGHDSFGTFFLWDLTKKMLVAKFDSQNNIISKTIPLSYFDINKSEFSNNNNNRKKLENYMAVWLLVSSCTSSESQINQTWRLGLLANDSLFLGHTFDPRICVVDGAHNIGLAGTYDGFCYKWDLQTGRNISWIDCFDSGSVTCIAVESKSGVVAVADNQNQVLIYAPQN